MHFNISIFALAIRYNFGGSHSSLEEFVELFEPLFSLWGVFNPYSFPPNLANPLPLLTSERAFLAQK